MNVLQPFRLEAALLNETAFNQDDSFIFYDKAPISRWMIADCHQLVSECNIPTYHSKDSATVIYCRRPPFLPS